MSGYRIGSGVDAHRLAAGRPLILAGITVAYDRGLEGHSDGDCVTHALCDALLGAAGAGDLGGLFPSSDPRWKGVSSLLFLQEVVGLVARKRYNIENADLTIIAQAPALAPYAAQMQLRLSECLGIEAARVCVKSKSTDGLGTIGRGEGIAALATVLLRQP